MAAYSAEELHWINKANDVVTGRRKMSDEELTTIAVDEDPALSLRSKADWLARMGKQMATREDKKQAAAMTEKVSRAELVMSLMGFCTMETYNHLLIYVMAMWKALEKRGLVTQEEIREMVKEFAKASQDKKEGEDDLDKLEKEIEEAAATESAPQEG